jgi:hypothetical protein
LHFWSTHSTPVFFELQGSRAKTDELSKGFVILNKIVLIIVVVFSDTWRELGRARTSLLLAVSKKSSREPQSTYKETKLGRCEQSVALLRKMHDAQSLRLTPESRLIFAHGWMFQAAFSILDTVSLLGPAKKICQLKTRSIALHGHINGQLANSHNQAKRFLAAVLSFFLWKTQMCLSVFTCSGLQRISERNNWRHGRPRDLDPKSEAR